MLNFIRGYSRLFEESSFLFEVIRGYSRKAHFYSRLFEGIRGNIQNVEK